MGLTASFATLTDGLARISAKQVRKLCMVNSLSGEHGVSVRLQTATSGVPKRMRSCIPPKFGGYNCPTETYHGVKYTDIEGCKPECAQESKAACNPVTWEKFSWACCTKKDPCYVDEGDCDNDNECAGDLVCGKNNCPDTFTVRRGKNRSDCCMKA